MGIRDCKCDSSDTCKSIIDCVAAIILMSVLEA